MKFRGGAWVLVAAFGVLVIVKTLTLGLSAAAWSAVGDGLLWTTTIAWLGCSAGLALCARDSRGWARVVFAIAAVASCLPAIVEVGSITGTAGRVLNTLGVSSYAAFAGAAMFRGAGKRLAWTVIPVAALFTLAIGVGGVGRGWPGLMPVDLMCMYLALDLLGTFPVLARVPQAAVHNPVLGRVITGVGFALIALGGWLMFVAFDEMAKHSAPSNTDLFYGMLAVLGGVLGLWRRRRDVSLPIAIAIVVVLGGSLETIASFVKRPFEDAVLTTREVPNARIELPSGEDTARAFSNVGEVSIVADHVGLDNVGLGWGYGTEPDLSNPTAAITKVRGVNVEVTSAIVDDTLPHRTAILIWTCNDVQMRASFGARGSFDRIQGLAARIARTIECMPPDPGVSHLVVPVSLPAEFRELAMPEIRFRTFRSADNRIAFSLAWTKDHDWRMELENSPLERFRWFIDPSEFETIVEPVRRTVLVVDGEYRWFGDFETKGRRLVTGIYYCRELGAYLAAGYDGPESVPLETAIDLIKTARCP